jgi:hypothetical protein
LPYAEYTLYTHRYTPYIRRSHTVVGSLAVERYISLTTFKRDGTPVSTPVWVTSDDGRRLLVWSATKTWKVRRLRRDARVLVAPSNFRGRERGRRLVGRARLITDPGIDQLLRRKYGWQKRALDLLNRRSEPESWSVIEIVDRKNLSCFLRKCLLK